MREGGEGGEGGERRRGSDRDKPAAYLSGEMVGDS